MKKIFSILALLLILSSCNGESKPLAEKETPNRKNPYSKELMQAIKTAKESEKKVDLYLEEVSSDKETLTIRLMMKNNNETEIKSIRSFLSYNPEVLEGDSITLSDSLGEILIAPNEKEFDNQNGIMKLGISIKSNKKSLEIAEIKFKKLKNEDIIIDFFDPQRGGHTEVIGIFGGHIKNLLKPVKSPAFISVKNEN